MGVLLLAVIELMVLFSCPVMSLGNPVDHSLPDFPVPYHVPELAQVHVHCIGGATQPSHPLTPFSLSALNLSQHQGLFQWFSCSHQWPKCWSFSFSISPSNEYSGLISFKIDWFDILSVQATLRSLLQHHSSKASILWHSAFFMVQLSQPYVTTGKTIALTTWTFVGKHTKFVIAFLPRSNGLLISWLQLPSTVILGTNKRKSVTTSTFSLSICPEVMNGVRYHDASIFNINFKLAFSLSSFTLIKRFFSSSSLSAIRALEWYHPNNLDCCCFSHLSWFQLVTHPARHFDDIKNLKSTKKENYET